ncbi:Uncharacterized membrane protein YckC, RDD family [Pedococcus dokdonensis]|uniref:Uncharacterized membrane protein YckC, RDD family n=1 Tax=Pedococcus dokdonensis TaxID=443156 RepID=A0A1H0QTT4_9MICO|nr:RDD family protein [Pedococcus dokdonensis]SDP20712.1 Uncharacterized membrane protein YckC, RDD family [Pedococcus dokdonensis]
MSTPTSPGWYDDPDDAAQLRYFDGVVWTRHTTPRSTRPAPSATQPSHATQPTSTQPGQPAYPPVGGQGTQGQQWQQAPQGQHPQFPGQPQQQGWNVPAHPGPARVATTPDGQPLASFWQRVGAYILDGIIQFVLLMVLGGWLAFKAFEPVWDDLVSAMESGDPAAFETITADNLNLGYIFAFGVVAAAITFGYAVFFLSRTGATPGKAAMGISVRLRDRPGVLSVGDAARRTSLQAGLSLLSNIPLVGNLFGLVSLLDLLWPAWDERKQALHDKLARTNVVVGKQPRP